MYQALYRKWRPRTFTEVSGQDHITETLKRQVESGRLSHAYIFVGTRGTGKTSCAKILARAINCEHPVGGEPCNKCPSCIGIENGSILDVVELDAASNNGVDNVRALREEAIYSPAAVKKRVYIIDEVHMLSGSAFNALLKILEEPPEHLVFILATTELHKVPATILSRCQRFLFKRLPSNIISDRLKYVASQEGFELTPQAADMLARLAGGAMRDGLSLLDQCSSEGAVDEARVVSVVGLSGAAETAALFACIRSGDTAGALETIDKLYSNGRDMSSVLSELGDLVRDILIYKLAKKNGEGLLSGEFDTDLLKKLSDTPTARLLSISDSLQNGNEAFASTSDRRLVAEMTLIRLCDETLSSGNIGLISRIEKLENTVKNGVAVSEVPVKLSEEEPEEEDEYVFDDRDEPQYGEEQEYTADIPQQEEIPFWDSVLTKVEKELEIPTYMMLCDKTDIDASLRGDTLVIVAKSAFTPNVINTAQVLDSLRNAAKDVLGRAVAVKVESVEASDRDKQNKLDALSRFENFEIK